MKLSMTWLRLFSFVSLVPLFAAAHAWADFCVSVYGLGPKGLRADYNTQCENQKPFSTAVKGWPGGASNSMAVSEITRELGKNGYSKLGTYYRGTVVVHARGFVDSTSSDSICLLAREKDSRGAAGENIIDCGDGAWIEVRDADLSSYLSKQGFQLLRQNVGEIAIKNRSAHLKAKTLHIYKK